MFHGSFGELLVDFAFEVFELPFDLFVGGDFASGWDLEGVGVFARDVVDAPRLKIQLDARGVRAQSGLAREVGRERRHLVRRKSVLVDERVAAARRSGGCLLMLALGPAALADGQLEGSDSMARVDLGITSRRRVALGRQVDAGHAAGE